MNDIFIYELMCKAIKLLIDTVEVIMDINNHLIIIKNEDKTSEIENFQEDKYYIKIKYKESYKKYNYVKTDLKFYTIMYGHILILLYIIKWIKN